MPAPKHSDAQFANIWHEEGCSPQRVAERVGTTLRNVYARRDRLKLRGVELPSQPVDGQKAKWQAYPTAYERERSLDLVNCSIIVGSDAHIWPGDYTVAMRALLAAIPIVKPVAIIANGDWIDGARISRHGRIGWARTPTVLEELNAVKAYADDVVSAAAKADRDCQFFWNMGNHDLRFDNYLSKQAPEFEGMPLMRLEDHLCRWQFQWSLRVNGAGPHPVVLKHKHNGGIHAGYNNTMKGGVTTVTSHTHLLEAKPWGDYRTERRWGVQTGCLADLHGPQFEYHENQPSAACAGFVVLTFRDGHLMPPETAEVIGGRCIFRREFIA